MDSTATPIRRVAVIGAGNVGRAIARGLRRTGHVVTIGVRDVASPKAAAAADDTGAALHPLADAARDAEVVVLAVPAAAVADTLAALGPLDGRVVVDATNAVGVAVPDGHPTMAAFVHSLAPGAEVVKAFNTLGAEHLAGNSFPGERLMLPIAGTPTGRAVVADLAEQMGFDVVDVGDLDTAVHVEAVAQLWIHLAFRRGLGRDFGFAVVRR